MKKIVHPPWFWVICGIAFLLPLVLHLVPFPEHGFVPAVLTYWATLILAYITWRYVRISQDIFEQTKVQVKAAEVQADAAQGMLTAQRAERQENVRPFVVPLRDFPLALSRAGKQSKGGAPVCFENSGLGPALDVAAWVHYGSSGASKPDQPFRSSCISRGEVFYAGDLTSFGDNSIDHVLRTMKVRVAFSDISGKRYRIKDDGTSLTVEEYAERDP